MRSWFGARAQIRVSRLHHQRLPVVAMGRRCDIQEGTLSDLKKRLLFDFLDLRDCYVEVEGRNVSSDEEARSFSEALDACLGNWQRRLSCIEEVRQDFRQRAESGLRELFL